MSQKLEKALNWIIPLLEKHKIRFQISGGLAAHLYGVQRSINDIDIDLPENRMEELLPDLKSYLVFGPTRYKDENWDLKLMTLNYEGQEIDLAGSFEGKIFNQKNKLWESYPAQSKIQMFIEVYNINIPIININDLIAYKMKLGREVDLIDVEGLRKYTKSN